MSTVVVIDPPSADVVSLVDAKAHMRVDGGDDDALITTLIQAATAHLDAPVGWLGRALITQTLELRSDGFLDCRDGGNGGILLRCPPVVSVTSVTYLDAGGAEQTFDPAGYRLVGDAMPRLMLSPGSHWPATSRQEEAVRVRYVAGYGDSPDDVPAPIRIAILLLVGHLYENRDLVTKDALQLLPWSVDALLMPYRIWS